MIDIIRDYAAVGVGTAQATSHRLARASRTGAALALDWSSSTLAEVQQVRLSEVPAGLLALVHSQRDRAVSGIGHAAGGPVKALNQLAQGLQHRLSDARGVL